jgi:hypothetical protein
MTSRVRGPYGTFASENHFSELARPLATAGGTLAAATRRNTAVQNLTGVASVTAADLGRLSSAAQIMTAGAGLTGAGFVYKSMVLQLGTLAYTRIFVDLTDLTAGGTTGDIIGGASGAASSNFGQVTAALNGTILAGWVDVIETPAGGDTDIDLWYADEATGAEDAAITGLTGETIMVNAGAWTAGQRKIFTGLPAANKYIYLVGIDGGGAAYTAGQFELTLLGSV